MSRIITRTSHSVLRQTLFGTSIMYYVSLCLGGYALLVASTLQMLDLHKLNITIDLKCPLFSEYEGTHHLFFECNFSFSIISYLIPDSGCLLLRPNTAHFLYWINDLPNTLAVAKRLYYLLTYCSIYFIWRERNDRHFGAKANSIFIITLKI
ncbi:hypothetical protein KFK09_002134 [Dendrobium nobile]|uniref:Uncharacterized protein n=1 Tax=Dendrobium nobile TaxID=94219 RepID=A0A8T3CC52_DENNO|nr:hypothetical protein KFK09_002134 [Dendrobium nobile]